MVQAGLSLKWDLIWKITNTKRAGGVVQVVEHLPKQTQGPEFNTQDHQKHFKKLKILIWG
jgi:hypothetical protein